MEDSSFDSTNDIRQAIAREKEIKKWSRAKKETLIASINPEWNDLAADWFAEGGLKVVPRPAP